jgi:nickel-dependent lactate racemase
MNDNPLLSESSIAEIVRTGLADCPYNGRRVLVLVPDLTRTMPLAFFFRLLVSALRPRVTKLDFMVALGTHAPLNEAQMDQLFGCQPGERVRDFADIGFLNHDWQNPEALTLLGTIPASEILNLSDGMLNMEVPVRINKRILDYDELFVCGPVFPHEVVGISGGNKYFFPGIAGQDIIDVTHWIGALVTSYALIGTKDTPVRRVIDRAAAMIPRPRRALCAVVRAEGVEGVFLGPIQDAWGKAADLAAQTHITWVPRPYRRVLSILPEMYDEIWVGAKGMYKLEPVIADGGEVIIFAPHIHHISVVHGNLIAQIGYHCRDYFVKQWDRFKGFPWGVLAHSTHLRGAGTFDSETCLERLRITVTLATSISEAECHALNLGWRDWRSIDIEAWEAEAERDPSILVVHRAGEQLYRLESGRP